MAFYDTPGLAYDASVFYDAVAAPQSQRKHMAKVKLNLKDLPDAQIIQQCTNYKTALTGNATFATPTPTLTAFGTLITTAQTKLTTADNAQTLAKQATADKNAAITALLAGAAQLATYVDLTANGDESKILSAGMQVRAAAAPAGVPGQVQNLSVTAGDADGELDSQWDPQAGAKSYELQMCPDPITSGGWASKPPVTKSKTSAGGLTSGARLWSRVRAIGSAGPGAWSDPAVKTVP